MTQQAKEKVNRIYSELSNLEKNLLFEKILLENTENDYSSLNDDDKDKAPNCFVCAFIYMKFIFWNCLMLGGSHNYHSEDKKKISELLDGLDEIIKKYKK